jgi:hypothetical protein
MSERKSKLYIDLSQATEPLLSGFDFSGADGYILASNEIPQGLDVDGKEILLHNIPPQSAPEIPDLASTCICSSGLEETADLRDRHPDFSWIPRVDAILQETAYHFPTAHYSESFRTYQPLFRNQSPYLVDDGNSSLKLWLKKAEELGFSSIWLHAPRAANAKKGLDLALRELVLRSWPGELWLSGGASTIMHVKYLVRQGGIDALIVPPALAGELGCEEIGDSLRLRLRMNMAQNGTKDAVKAGAKDLPQGKGQG